MMQDHNVSFALLVQRWGKIYSLVGFVEAVLAAATLALLPRDPKHAALLGYSWPRLAMIAFALALAGGFAGLWREMRRGSVSVGHRVVSALLQKWVLVVLCGAGILGGFYLYVISVPLAHLVLPAYRLRLMPLTILLLLVYIQTVALLVGLYFLDNEISLDRYAVLLALIGGYVVWANFHRFDFWYSDDYIWLPLTKNFFRYIGSSDGIHRPLFAFVSWLIYAPIGRGLTRLPAFSAADEDVLVATVWLFSNVIFYFLAIALGYRAIWRFTGSRHKGFFFAVLIAISAEMYAWLNHSLINVHGVALYYIVLWMGVDYLMTPHEQRSKKLVWYGLLYGVLMLGKAQYNIVGAIIVFTVLFAREYWRVVLKFTLIQFIPLVAWIGGLRAFGLSYRNYEISRSDYTLVGALISRFGRPTWYETLYAFYTAVFKKADIMIIQGLGGVMLMAIWLFIGYRIATGMGKFMLVYYIVTAVFLLVVNFALPRHAYDFAPIAYLGTAHFIDWARWKMSPRTFWILYGVSMVVLMLINQSDMVRVPIVGR